MQTENLSAIGHAIELRRSILEALEAEPEWTDGDDYDKRIRYAAGPAETILSIEARDTHESVVALEVLTPVAQVPQDRREVLETFEWASNGFTTTSRWATAFHRGPAGWDRHVSRETVLSLHTPELGPDVAGVLALGCSFVLAPSLEIPFAAVVETVREQIAAANAVAISWPQPDEVRSLAQLQRFDSERWSPVLAHFDQVVTHDGPVDTVMTSAEHGLAFMARHQEESGSDTWLMSSDPDGRILCEVPYGPGPYGGTIGVSALDPAERGPETRTSLVSIEPLKDEAAWNPQVGPGVMVSMRLVRDIPEGLEPWWAAHLLNKMSRQYASSVDGRFAHGIGAWVPDGDAEVRWVLYLPAAWGRIMSENDLGWLMMELLQNCARLSWGARLVMETLGSDATALQPGGFVSDSPRGIAFGEI